MRYLRDLMNYVIKYNEFFIVLKRYNDDNWIFDSRETKFTSS